MVTVSLMLVVPEAVLPVALVADELNANPVNPAGNVSATVAVPASGPLFITWMV